MVSEAEIVYLWENVCDCVYRFVADVSNFGMRGALRGASV